MPMKIETMTAHGATLSPARPEEDKVYGMDTDFSSELRDKQSQVSEESLQKLFDQIDRQGARLTNTPTYDELKEYRSLIKKFVGEAVNLMYERRSNAGWDRMGRQKTYTTVRKIDKKLEDMAEKIRIGQADKLDIAASHDAIRGMLIDLYM